MDPLHGLKASHPDFLHSCLSPSHCCQLSVPISLQLLANMIAQRNRINSWTHTFQKREAYTSGIENHLGLKLWEWNTFGLSLFWLLVINLWSPPSSMGGHENPVKDKNKKNSKEQTCRISLISLGNGTVDILWEDYNIHNEAIIIFLFSNTASFCLFWRNGSF